MKNYRGIYKNYDHNIEIMEVRVCPKGTQRDKVCETGIEAGECHIMFIGGTTALVPLHCLVSNGPIGPDWDRWIILKRYQDYQVNILDVVFEKFSSGEDNKGDVCLFTTIFINFSFIQFISASCRLF